MWLSLWTYTNTVRGHPQYSWINEQEIRIQFLSTHTWWCSDFMIQWLWRFITSVKQSSSDKVTLQPHCIGMQCVPWGFFLITNAARLWALSYLLFGIQRWSFSLSLNIFKESSLNNNMSGVTISWMFEYFKAKPSTCVCVYLVSVSQVLRLHVSQSLPVGESSASAGFHLCQRLSIHGMTLLVIPVWERTNTSHC